MATQTKGLRLARSLVSTLVGWLVGGLSSQSASIARHSTELSLLSVLHAETSQSTHGSTPRTAESCSPLRTTHAQHQATGRCSHWSIVRRETPTTLLPRASRVLLTGPWWLAPATEDLQSVTYAKCAYCSYYFRAPNLQSPTTKKESVKTMWNLTD
jgi:hypothetical protein